MGWMVRNLVVDMWLEGPGRITRTCRHLRFWDVRASAWRGYSQDLQAGFILMIPRLNISFAFCIFNLMQILLLPWHLTSYQMSQASEGIVEGGSRAPSCAAVVTWQKVVSEVFVFFQRRRFYSERQMRSHTLGGFGFVHCVCRINRSIDM